MHPFFSFCFLSQLYTGLLLFCFMSFNMCFLLIDTSQSITGLVKYLYPFVAGEIVPSLKALIAFPENPELVSSTNLATNNSFFWLLQVLHPHGTQTFIQASIYIHKIQVNLLQKYQKLFFLFPQKYPCGHWLCGQGQVCALFPTLLTVFPNQHSDINIHSSCLAFLLLTQLYLLQQPEAFRSIWHVQYFLITILLSCTQVLYSHL